MIRGLSAAVENCVNAVEALGDGTVFLNISLLDLDTISGNTITDTSNTLNGYIGVRQFGGMSIGGSANLRIIALDQPSGAWSGQPAVPSSTTAQKNTSWRDAAVSVKGGTVTVVAVDGVTVATATNTTVVVPSGKNITLTYSAAPTWAWTLM
jgi:hypothetical protein